MFDFLKKSLPQRADKSPAAATGLTQQLQQTRILLVNNNRPQSLRIRTLLNSLGCHNIGACNTDEVWPRLQQSVLNGVCSIDLLLLDMQQSIEDNHALCRKLGNHALYDSIPVIMICGEPDWKNQIMRVTRETNATHVLCMPIRGVELASHLVSAMFLKREREQHKWRALELQNAAAESRVHEARLHYLAAHDDLTGLYNRRRLEQMLEVAALRVRVKTRPGALLYIDLDQFRLINDMQSHQMGDRLLAAIADLLRRQCAYDHTLARISSDEFVLLMENTTQEQALAGAEALRRSLDKFHFETRERSYRVSASIGVAMLQPDEYIDAHTLLARADQACYAAKTHGRNQVHLYTLEDRSVHLLKNDAHWAPLIQDALANGKLHLQFQPIMEVNGGRMTHYEALVRMQGHSNQLLPPAEFIPVAERMGLVHEIDLWVVTQVLDLLQQLQHSSPELALNINLSTKVLQNHRLLPLVRDKLQQSGVNPRNVVFEITETAAIANLPLMRDMVQQLRDLGCRFALDDFGAGFNSFNYLKHFPVDYLKIDGSFIVNLAGDPADQALVKSMIEIARQLGKRTVAEFVENAETLELLKEYGVDYVQGYHIGRPQALLYPA
ncbi:MAG: EAL domain-containing protein [Gammaproteobacteria bacterium]|nr:MAG: EAL domain-containing protein [Gammaproteobacteria bacterium]